MQKTAENRSRRMYFPPGVVKHAGRAVGPHWQTAGQPPLSAINDIVKNHVSYTANRGRMPVREPASDVGGWGGSIEHLLPPRTFPQRGEMDSNQNGDWRFSWGSPAFRTTLLPLLDGPAGPSSGDDIAPLGSSPDFVCGIHSHFGRHPAIRFNEPRYSSSNMQRSRLDCQHK